MLASQDDMIYLEISMSKVRSTQMHQATVKKVIQEENDIYYRAHNIISKDGGFPWMEYKIDVYLIERI